MRAPLLYRIASAVFVLFGIGHTVGFLTFKPPTAEGLAVLNSMNAVYFQVGSSLFSYGGWYKGFGLSITANNLFSAVVAWYLAGVAARSPGTGGLLAWSFFALQVVGLALSWIWFGVPPIVLAALVAVLLGWAAWQMQRAKA